MSERAFKEWYGRWAKEADLDPNPADPRHHYDYRAAFKAGANPVRDPQDGNRYHFDSRFKAQDHPNRYVNGQDTITGEPMTSLARLASYPEEDSPQRRAGMAPLRGRDGSATWAYRNASQDPGASYPEDGDVGTAQEYVKEDPYAGMEPQRQQYRQRYSREPKGPGARLQELGDPALEPIPKRSVTGTEIGQPVFNVPGSELYKMAKAPDLAARAVNPQMMGKRNRQRERAEGDGLARAPQLEPIPQRPTAAQLAAQKQWADPGFVENAATGLLSKVKTSQFVANDEGLVPWSALPAEFRKLLPPDNGMAVGISLKDLNSHETELLKRLVQAEAKAKARARAQEEMENSSGPQRP